MRTRSSLAAALLLAALPASAAAPDAEAGQLKAGVCVACHGAGGNSSRAIFPSLAGQAPLYTYYQLLQYRDGRRKDPAMSAVAAGMTDADMKDLAEYYSKQAPHVPDKALEPAQIEAGKAIAMRNYCGSCHMPDYSGQKHIPRIASQHYDYLVKELRGFKTGARPDIDGTMASAAQPLSDKDITDMAAYLSGLR